MKTLYSFLISVFIVCSMTASAQLSTKGTDFWLGFSQNYDDVGFLKVFITSDVATTGVISVPQAGYTENFTVAANTTTMIIMPFNTVYNAGSETVNNTGIHVLANAPVSVYALNEQPFTSDATGVLPTPALGTVYTVAGARDNSRESQFLIVATEDNTVVTINPTVQTNALRSANVPFDITLQRGQSYQVQSRVANSHLNGTTLTSTKPIAVFAGGICTNISGCGFCDHIFEQNMPTNRLGQNFIIIPLALRTVGTFYDVIATENGTIVQRNGIVVATLNARQTFSFSSTQREVITSSAPIALMQYSPGTACDGVASDPFVVYVPPVDQMIDRIVFNAFVTPNIPSYFVNIITATSNTANVTLDGAPVTGFTTISNDPTMSATTASVIGGTHILDAGGDKLSAMIYGYGQADSYGYLAGTAATALRGSDIVVTPEFSYMQNIPYIDYRANDITTTNSVAVMGLTVRDGGATAPDNDGFTTTMTSLTIEVSHPDMIRRLALYDGINEIAEVSIPCCTTSVAQFTGLNIVVPDNGTRTLEVRATFTESVSDNTQLQFRVVEAVSVPGGTEFRDLDGGGATSSMDGDDNRLEVIADRLRFLGQPSDVDVDVMMQPDVTVEAIDEFNNRDRDVEGREVFITNRRLNNSPEGALMNEDGIARYGTLTFGEASPFEQLTAASPGYQPGLSTAFAIRGEGATGNRILHLNAGTHSGPDGTLTSFWDDIAGNDDNGEQSVMARRPALRNSAAFLINSHPVVQFGVGRGMQINTRSELSGGSSKTMFAVIRTGANVTSRQMLMEFGGIPGGFNMYIDGFRLYAGVWDQLRAWHLNRQVLPNRVYLVQYVYDGSRNRLSLNSTSYLIEAASLAVNFRDPDIQGGNQLNGIGAVVQQTRYHNAYSFLPFGDPFLGQIAEVIMLNTADVDERTAVFEELNLKYNIGALGNPLLKESEEENIANQPLPSVELMPNPANDLVTLFSNGAAIRQITITTMEGVEVQKLYLSGEYTTRTFETNRLAAGMYRVSVRTTEETVNIPLTIVR
jgi:hypothetical protein